MFYHPFHIVTPSPWPIFGGLGALGLTTGGVLVFHSYELGWDIAALGLVIILLVMYNWFSDMVVEGTFLGDHTSAVQNGILLGMVLFIVSEILFFFSIFWGFFHSALAPEISIGAVWPPVGISTIAAWDIPLFNTALLLTSGATVTWAHHAMASGGDSDCVESARVEANYGLILTVLLGLIFTTVQYEEYVETTYTMADSIFGSIFFLSTGFHGFHVLVGTLFLFFCLLRLLSHHYTPTHHTGLLCAISYWHMVDVVWVFLFIWVYWWGG